jgi:flagellar basal body-associated protein FliL
MLTVVDIASDFQYDTEEERHSVKSYRIIIVVSLLLAAIVVALYIHFFVIKKSNNSIKPLYSVQNEKESRSSENTPVETAERNLPLPFDLPPLNESDAYIRDALTNASPFREFQNWLKETDIIRRFVAAVDNLVSGENPAANLNFLKPEEDFRVIAQKHNLIMDPNNYIRHDRSISIFESLDIKILLDLFYRIEPLLDETYQKMGYPGQHFRPVLIRAVEIIMDIPVIKDPILLQKKVITYSFLNQEFEKLTPGQKLILRSGPNNIRKIQNKCREFNRFIRSPAEQ